MPLLSPAASGDGTHALKHKMYQERETQREGEVRNEVDGEGAKKKKKPTRFTEQEKVMRGKIAKQIREIYMTLCFLLKDTLTRHAVYWTHTEPVTFGWHDSQIQATPSSVLVFALPRIFHCWQVSTSSSVECQYDTVHTDMATNTAGSTHRLW